MLLQQLIEPEILSTLFATEISQSGVLAQVLLVVLHAGKPLFALTACELVDSLVRIQVVFVAVFGSEVSAA